MGRPWPLAENPTSVRTFSVRSGRSTRGSIPPNVRSPVRALPRQPETCRQLRDMRPMPSSEPKEMVTFWRRSNGRLNARGHAEIVSWLSQPSSSMDTRRVALNIDGWSLDTRGSSPERSTWRDGDGDTITLTAAATAIAETITADVGELRTYCRQLAENHGAGLVEANAALGPLGPTVHLIYKKLEEPAFTFTGVQIIPLLKASLIWSVVADEKGMTGVREAVVTSALMDQGKLTLETYKRSWSTDPYEPLYRGVDRSTLRYMSDDPSYDNQFPNQPLSKVRRVLRELLRQPDLGAVVPNPPMQPTGSAGG